MADARYKGPDTALILGAIVVAAAVLTWFVPPGAYERTDMAVPGVGTREVVVAGTFHLLEEEARSPFGTVLHSTGMVFKAPILGLTDPEAAPIVAFVLLIGGTFSVLQRTGAVDAALRGLIAVSRKSPALESALLPVFITVFSLGGAVFGMAEETVPFVLIFVPLALALGMIRSPAPLFRSSVRKRASPRRSSTRSPSVWRRGLPVSHHFLARPFGLGSGLYVPP
jgi:uncharacterized ion transporter superfamily protein YfcC